MQNLLSSMQMKEADAHTIAALPISAIDLMEQAALSFLKVFKKYIPSKQKEIAVLCGKGNNGGDGLAIGRLLVKSGYKQVKVYIINFSAKESPEFTKNYNRLLKSKAEFQVVGEVADFQTTASVIIDAILGAGLNKPLNGKYANLAKAINETNAKVIAVDAPTGFAAEGPIDENYKGVKAHLTVTFQRPKINFFFPESALAFDEFEVVDIGLDENFINQQQSNWKLITKKSILQVLKDRKKFSHKGTYGHALLVGGNTNTMGAALLMAKGCLHTGAGLTTVFLPKNGLKALNTVLPEVMALPRNEHGDLEDFSKFTAIGVGPGLGLGKANEQLLSHLVSLKKTLVLDADALTILAKQKELMERLQEGSILTPHVKEFDRLFGAHPNWWTRVQTAQDIAMKRKIVIVLKNRYTFVCLPNGDICINPTGNPAMASGGMGDVLTGMITAFLAQGYRSDEAALLATFIHGKTGDVLAKNRAVVTAGELAISIPKILKKLLIDKKSS